MKSKLFLQVAWMLLLVFGFQFGFASGSGSVMGRVFDPETKKPAPDVTVVFECQGNQRNFTTNDSGYYYASNLPVGIYNITAVFMSTHMTIANVPLTEDEQKVLDIQFATTTVKDSVVIVEYRRPLISTFDPTQKTLDRGDFTKLPITKLPDITSQQVGVTDINGVFYVRGAREGSLKYYIDGGPTMAQADIPLCGLENYTIYTGFMPPKYGDSVGGVVVLETRNFFSENH